jgi:hypothetical protein
MHKIISIFLSLLFVSTLSADSSYIKMKTVLNQDIYNAKFRIKQIMIDKNEAIKRGEKAQYISHIVADIDNKVIYDVWTSPLISTYPIFKFKFKYSGESDTVNLNVYDNNNKLEKRTFKLNDSNLTAIKESSEFIHTGTKNFPSKAWEASTVSEGVKVLYGEHTKFEKGIDVEVPDVISNKMHNRITIKSKLDLESIAVFAESYFQDSLRAIFIIPKDGIIDFSLPIKIKAVECKKNTKVTVIGKNRDNTMYKTIASAKYCACGDACIDD